MKDSFRQDINGLRAVAVLAVMLFHFRVPPFTGGFVGVDVFFVISGYLMTDILVTGLFRPGFRIWRFYLQRLARIVPALLAMAVAVLLLGSVIVLPQQFALMAREALASVLFAVNVHFATDTGYFSPVAAQSWFLHCWSLAVECQFYLAYPLILFAAKRVGGRRGVLAALVIGATLSAGYCFFETERSPTTAFYLVFSRFWEFVAGGLVPFLPPPRRGRTMIATAGLALVGAGVFLFDDTLRYPALWPAVPVAGAAAAIWARSALPVLANPVAQAFGTISYSLYLWHWPLLLAARYFALVDTGLGVAGLFAATSLAGWLSYRFVETPCRALFQRVSAPRIVGGAAAMAAVVGACLVITARDGLPGRLPETVRILAQQAAPPGEWRLGQCFLLPEQNFASFAPQCFEHPATSGKPRLMLWGDSHVAALYPGLIDQTWASNYGVEQANASSCAPYENDDGPERPNCPDVRHRVGAFVKQSKPDVVLIGVSVLLSGPRRGEPVRTDQKPLEVRVGALVADLRAAGVGKVIVMGPVPTWDLPLPDVYFRERFRSGSADPDMIRPLQFDRLKLYDAGLRAVTEASGGRYVSLADGLCRGDVCHALVPTAVGPRLLQFDGEHLTHAGSDWVAGTLIGPALGEPPSVVTPVARNVALDFKDGAAGTKYLAHDWMHPEPWGTWTAAGRTGVLTLPILGAWQPSRVRVTFWGLVLPTFPKERMWLQIAGDRPVPADVAMPDPIVTATVELGPGALAEVAATGYLTIRFWAPDARSPKQLGYNEDTRVLGFGLRLLTVE